MNPFPAVSAVPTGLAELLDVFPGLTSWAIFRPPPFDKRRADSSGLNWKIAVLTQGLNRLRKKSAPGRKDLPQGLKPDVFSTIYGTTKVVP